MVLVTLCIVFEFTILVVKSINEEIFIEKVFLGFRQRAKIQISAYLAIYRGKNQLLRIEFDIQTPFYWKISKQRRIYFEKNEWTQQRFWDESEICSYFQTKIQIDILVDGKVFQNETIFQTWSEGYKKHQNVE